MGWVGVDVDGAATSGALAWVRLDSGGEAGARGATPIAAEHVASLGATQPVIVDGTPYGREALLGEALRTIVAEARADPLDGLGLIHDDDADHYRLTLLVEAARLAGVAPDRVVLVPRSGDDDGPRRAAGAALAMLPVAGGTGAAAAAGIGGGAGAVGGAILGSHLLDGGATAVGAGATAGPAGAALSGPTGAAMTGPVGAPLAGPTGQAAAGPAGTGVAGPTGNVIVPVAQAASKAKWLPILGGAAVGVAAIVGVAVVATRGGDELVEADASITVEAEPPAPTLVEPPDVTASPTTAATAPVTTAVSTTVAPTTTSSSTTTTTTTTVTPEGDFTALLGSWQTGCISESGGSAQVVYTLSGESVEALSLGAAVTAYASPGCTGASQTYDDAIPASVTGTTVVDGLATFQIRTADGNGIMAVDGDTLYLGAFEDTSSYPTAFDPMWTCTRV